MYLVRQARVLPPAIERDDVDAQAAWSGSAARDRLSAGARGFACMGRGGREGRQRPAAVPEVLSCARPALNRLSKDFDERPSRNLLFRWSADRSRFAEAA